MVTWLTTLVNIYKRFAQANRRPLETGTHFALGDAGIAFVGVQSCFDCGEQAHHAGDVIV